MGEEWSSHLSSPGDRYCPYSVHVVPPVSGGRLPSEVHSWYTTDKQDNLCSDRESHTVCGHR